MKRKIKFLLALALTLAGFSFAFDVESVSAATEEVITKGVWIGGIDVSGMTKSEAESAIDAYVNSLLSNTFTLTGEKGSIEATAEQMGLNAETELCIEEAYAVGRSGNLIHRYKEIKNLERDNLMLDLELEIDKQMTARLIYDGLDELELPAKDSGMTLNNGVFTYIPGEDGTEINIIDSVLMIKDFLNDAWTGENNEITLISESVEARGTEEELAKVRDLLGTFTTDYTTSETGRKQNVENGCSKVNGTLVYPGDEVSAYKLTSPYTIENGYGVGGAYLNGATIDSIGGGICQVSTTLYLAVCNAELDITMRYNHSMLVTYVNPSEDAAIAGTYKDMRFVNNLEYPVYIEGYCKNNKITFNIYGVETRPANRVVTFESETLSSTDPGTEYHLIDTQGLGYYSVVQGKHMGNVSRRWKIVTVDGVEQSREVFNKSTYRSSPRIVEIGIAGATPEQIAALNSAVATAMATGDEKLMEATVTSMVTPVTEPPVTEPPVTEPPVTEPPVTEPPVTEPTTPPAAEPPVTTEPAAAETPTQPSVETPVTEPPAAGN